MQLGLHKYTLKRVHGVLKFFFFLYYCTRVWKIMEMMFWACDCDCVEVVSLIYKEDWVMSNNASILFCLCMLCGQYRWFCFSCSDKRAQNIEQLLSICLSHRQEALDHRLLDQLGVKYYQTRVIEQGILESVVCPWHRHIVPYPLSVSPIRWLPCIDSRV